MTAANLPLEFKQAIPVLTALEAAGYEAYFVGGSVRDWLLKKTIHDVDIATSAYPEEVKQLFDRTIDVGIEHGTVLALVDNEQYEITTFRTESTYQDYRRPDHVTFVRSLSEDLKRRDFTINALAMTVTGDIVDLFDGISDLERQVIRAVGVPSHRFNEDALRVMRGLRFASQLGFDIEPATLAAIEEKAPLLQKISVERIHIEFIKLLLSKDRQAGLQAMIKTKAYQFCPGLSEGQSALLQLATTSHRPLKSESQAWLLLLYWLEISVDDAKAWLKQWKLSNQLISDVTHALAGLHQRMIEPLSNEWLYRLGLDLSLLIESTMPFIKEEGDLDQVAHSYRCLPIKTIQDLAVNGKLLINSFKRPAGPWLGLLLKELTSQVLSKTVPNEKEALLNLSQKIIGK